MQASVSINSLIRLSHIILQIVLTDIDECFFAATTGVDLCEDDGNSQCVNSEGTFVCECVPGYEQINGTCSSKHPP